MPWAFGLRRLQVPGVVVGLAGMPYDHARNQACIQALQNGFQYVFFLDSDVIAPPDTIFRLMRHNLPIVSGLYCRRSPPHAIPVMLKEGKWVTSFPKDSLIEVDLVGAGCLLINTQVLRSMPQHRPGKHWFDWQVDIKGTGLAPDGECTSEDFVFNIHARANGFPSYVDTSVICKHVGLAEAGVGTFTPVESFQA